MRLLSALTSSLGSYGELCGALTVSSSVLYGTTCERRSITQCLWRLPSTLGSHRRDRKVPAILARFLRPIGSSRPGLETERRRATHQCSKSDWDGCPVVSSRPLDRERYCGLVLFASACSTR